MLGISKVVSPTCLVNRIWWCNCWHARLGCGRSLGVDRGFESNRRLLNWYKKCTQKEKERRLVCLESR